MRKGSLLCLLFFIILISFVTAQQDEFSVRFHSFGKNVTIDLKQYLGESEHYLASQTSDVIVKINQEKGLATLIARPGWEGSEVIFFRTNESIQKINNTEKTAKFLTAVPELLHLRAIRDEELARLFEATIDPTILDLIKEIKKEEIKNLSSEIDQKLIKIRINNEVDLNLELGYIPSLSMDFSLMEQDEVEEIQPKTEEVKLDINNNIILAIFSIAAVVGIYFYSKHRQKTIVQRKDAKLDFIINKDLKQLSLYKLRKLQANPNTEKFIDISRDFFSRYFGIEYNLDFKHIIKRVQESNINRNMKKEIKEFLNDLSQIVYSPTKKWADIYGPEKIQNKELKKLIKKLKRIIRNL